MQTEGREGRRREEKGRECGRGREEGEGEKGEEDTVGAWEQYLPSQQFCHDAANRPDVSWRERGREGGREGGKVRRK